MASSTERPPPPPKDVGANANSLAQVVGPSGSRFRVMVASGDRVIWSCSHVRFTEHSAKACAGALTLAECYA